MQLRQDVKFFESHVLQPGPALQGVHTPWMGT